jgi:hypothetical protein
MSEYDISQKTYSPDSTNEFDETINEKNSSRIIDMKTPQSLDDLLDVDDNNNQNEEDKEENENNNDDNDDNNSMHLTIDDPTTTEQTKQKKSIEKNGKI